MALRFPRDGGEIELFSHSRDQGGGMKPRPNTDVLSGLQFAAELTSTTPHQNITTTWTDLNAMTTTFELEFDGRALVIFTGKFLLESDVHDAGAHVRVVVDGTPVTAAERHMNSDFYTSHTGNQPLLSGNLQVYSVPVSVIVALAPGSHTIKIQAKSHTAAQVIDAQDRRMDIAIWHAPPGTTW